MVFADRYRDATGFWQRAGVWIEALAGILKEAPKEHRHIMLQDLRYALRTARKSPGFTTTAVLTLGLGIGGNTAIFQIISAVKLQSLPVRNPSELVEVRIAGGNKGFGLNPGRYGGLTRPVWQELRDHQQALSGAFAWATRDLRAGEGTDLKRVNGLAVSGEFFGVLGIQAWRGRVIEPGDETACPPTRAVVSHAYWRDHMGGRELGRDARLTLDGRVHEVIGVTPAGFFGLAVGESFDVAVPFCQPKELRREVFDVAVMGRLRPGWTVDRASAHVDALSSGIFEAAAPTGYSARSLETFKAFRLAAYPAASGVSWLRAEYDAPLRILLAITGLVLLIACANLANLMLARAIAREREVSVRLALGASRIRLLRQFLAESSLLAAAGALLGVGLAHVFSRLLLRALATEELAPTLPLSTDWRVLLFTALVAAGACLLFGITPALRATRIEPASAMKVGGRGLSIGGGRLSAQRVMVVTQLAFSLVLLVAALLFVRSFRNLITFDPGMRQEGITLAFVGFPASNVARDAINDFQRALLAEVQAVPGILDAGTTTNIPLLGSSWSHGVQVGDKEDSSQFTWVSPGYFSTMRIPILQGRDFTLQDTRTSPRVAIVNEAFVRRFAGRASPIGQTLRTSPEPNFPSSVYEIVGVIPDTQYDSLRSGLKPMVFAPDSQYPSLGPWTVMVIHSNLEPATAIASVKRRLGGLHPDIVAEFGVFKSRIRDGLLRERLLAMLAGFFGALAALLTMVGLYGMVAFAVAQRRHEIGIRLALGAARRKVIGMVMREAQSLVVVGGVLGAGLSLLAGPAAAALMFGLEPDDPTTLLMAFLLLAAIAAVASFVPARAAARVDPLTALRQE